MYNMLALCSSSQPASRAASQPTSVSPTQRTVRALAVLRERRVRPLWQLRNRQLLVGRQGRRLGVRHVDLDVALVSGARRLVGHRVLLVRHEVAALLEREAVEICVTGNVRTHKLLPSWRV